MLAEGGNTKNSFYNVCLAPFDYEPLAHVNTVVHR